MKITPRELAAGIRTLIREAIGDDGVVGDSAKLRLALAALRDFDWNNSAFDLLDENRMLFDLLDNLPKNLSVTLHGCAAELGSAPVPTNFLEALDRNESLRKILTEAIDIVSGTDAAADNPARDIWRARVADAFARQIRA